MVVGVCRISFVLAGNDSLKAKRSISKRLVSRVHHQFNAAVAEVEDMDVHRRLVLGVAVVSNDSRHANQMLDRIASFMTGLTEARMVDRDMEILPYGKF